MRLQLQSWGACAVAQYAVDWGHGLSKSYTVVATRPSTPYTTSVVVRAWEHVHVPELFFCPPRLVVNASAAGHGGAGFLPIYNLHLRR